MHPILQHFVFMFILFHQRQLNTFLCACSFRGAWGAQRATGRSSSMTSPAALVINSYDDDFDDDTLEELMA